MQTRRPLSSKTIAISHQKRLLVGKINGLFGVQGWVKVFSHTEPRKNILTYQPWHIKVDGQWQTLDIIKGREQGKTLVAQIKDIHNPEQANNMIGVDIYIEQSQLPELPDGEHYWRDLIGLEVINQQQIVLGKVSTLVDTGANNVLVVSGEKEYPCPSRGHRTESREHKKEHPSRGCKKEHWIPYIEPFLIQVDMANGQILVDWDADF